MEALFIFVRIRTQHIYLKLFIGDVREGLICYLKSILDVFLIRAT